MKYPRKSCPTCQTLMRRHDKRGGAQRWYCPQCDKVVSGRAPLTESLKLGQGTPRAVAEEVARGEPDERIVKTLAMSSAGLEAQLNVIAEQAEEHYKQEPPRIAGGWYAVASAGYDVAVGVQRRGFRVLEWVPPNNPTSLAVVVGSTPIGAGTARMQTWLNKTLAPAAGQPAEVERRLWIVMAWTNAWIKG